MRSKAGESRTPAEQNSDMTTDRTETNMDMTEQREREPPNGQPTNMAAGPTNRKAKAKNQNKGKTLAKAKEKRKASDKEDSSSTAERADMDWAGQDDDDNVLRESRPRACRRLQAHGPFDCVRV